MNLRQAAEMALEALVNFGQGNSEPAKALRQALAQPEQEPVAWMVYTLDGQSVCVTDNPADFTDKHRALPLWPGPFEREWVGLTEEERDWCINGTAWVGEEKEVRVKIAKAIEAKLKEKNI